MKAYRLLDEGEPRTDGDEVLTVGGWIAQGRGVVVDITNPIRRPDDGKGKYVLIERPNVVEMGDYTDTVTEFWAWGAGWLMAGKLSIFTDAVIWRKAREIAPKNEPENWIIIVDGEQVTNPMPRDRAIAEAKNIRERRPRVFIAQIVYEVTFETKLVEVGK